MLKAPNKLLKIYRTNIAEKGNYIMQTLKDLTTVPKKKQNIKVFTNSVNASVISLLRNKNSSRTKHSGYDPVHLSNKFEFNWIRTLSHFLWP